MDKIQLNRLQTGDHLISVAKDELTRKMKWQIRSVDQDAKIGGLPRKTDIAGVPC